MLSGVRFNLLEYGDILIDKNWSYRNLWGLAASKQKLLDQFAYSKEIGFKIIQDTIRPTYNSVGNLTLENNGYNSRLWPLYDPVGGDDRLSIYRNEIKSKDFTFICKLDFPEDLTSENMDEYVEFFIDLIQNPDFAWIENWIFFESPETLKYVELNNTFIPKVSPRNYVTFLGTVRSLARKVNPSVKIGGPGIFKGLSSLDNNNPLKQDDTFYHNWLKEALDLSLLKNIDFFTVQLRQDIFGLEYDNIKSLSILLKDKIEIELGSENIMPIYSLNQGRQELDKTDINKLLNQNYYCVSEMLNTAKNGIIPIINCISDFPDDPNLNQFYNPAIDGFGILKFDLTKKPQFETMKFIIRSLENHSQLTYNSNFYENSFADDISFINEGSNVKEPSAISVIWSKYNKPNKITILPNADQYYMLVDGTVEKMINPYEFVTEREFIIVVQRLNTDSIDYEDIRSTIFKKYVYNTSTMDNLLSAIPENYNKSLVDTNIYRILRSFALEYSDAKVQIDTLKEDLYLDTVRKESIYSNFGKLVGLEKQYDWDYEKYRKLIKGVIESLLTGPTKQSIEAAANLFINYENVYLANEKIADIKIYELYENEGADPEIYGGIHAQFAFIVEVSKNVDIGMDQNVLNRDLKYIINILKPAHTLSFVVIILTGSENYKDQYYDKYGVNFKNMDEYSFEGTLGGNYGKTEGAYGWKHINYAGSFHTYDFNNKNNNSKLNGGILLGPRRTIQDTNFQHLKKNSVELYASPKDHLTGFTMGCPTISNKIAEYSSCRNCPNAEECYLKKGKGSLGEKYIPVGDLVEFDRELVESDYKIKKPEYSVYKMGKTRFPGSKLPDNYLGNMPGDILDEFKPLGIGVRLSDSVEMIVSKIINGKEVIIRKESL